jgi:hypothetical protein
MGAIDFSIDMRLVECLQLALPISVFVETGTFEGEAIARVRGSFDEIHSIELSDHYYGRAADRFAGDPQLRLYHGDSSEVLDSLRPTLADRGVLYWLDAHWCVADETAGERSQCPLLRELAALGRLNTESVVLIDDARLFLATPPHPHEASDWPRFQQVLQRLLPLSSSHEIMVINDVILFFPATAVTAVSEYARSYGTDWLAELHRGAEFEQERDAFSRAAVERLEAIEALTREADRRASLIDRLTAALEESEQRPVDSSASASLDSSSPPATKTGSRASNSSIETSAEPSASASEEPSRDDRTTGRDSWTVVEESSERKPHVRTVPESRTVIDELRCELDLQANAAVERLAVIEELKRERDLMAQVAEERLSALGALARERDLQAEAAEARLAVIRELELRLRALSELDAAQDRAAR